MEFSNGNPNDPGCNCGLDSKVIYFEIPNHYYVAVSYSKGMDPTRCFSAFHNDGRLAPSIDNGPVTWYKRS